MEKPVQANLPGSRVMRIANTINDTLHRAHDERATGISTADPRYNRVLKGKKRVLLNYFNILGASPSYFPTARASSQRKRRQDAW